MRLYCEFFDNCIIKDKGGCSGYSDVIININNVSDKFCPYKDNVKRSHLTEFEYKMVRSLKKKGELNG